MKRNTLFTTSLALAVSVAPVLGGIPLPDVVLHSQVVVDYEVATAADDITIFARCCGNEVAHYKMGAVPQAGDKFILRIPVESLADGADPNPKAVRLGDTVEIFAVQNDICNGGENDGLLCFAHEECPGGDCGGVESFVTTVAIEQMGTNEDLDLLCALRVWGDLVPPFAFEGPLIQPDLEDILCVLSAFAAGGEWETACPLGDLLTDPAEPGCAPNGIVDLQDILAILAAFEGNPPCPVDCS